MKEGLTSRRHVDQLYTVEVSAHDVYKRHRLLRWLPDLGSDGAPFVTFRGFVVATCARKLDDSFIKIFQMLVECLGVHEICKSLA